MLSWNSVMGTAPNLDSFAGQNRGGAQDLLRNVTREDSEKVLQPDATCSAQQKMKVIPANGLAVNSHAEFARKFFSDVID